MDNTFKKILSSIFENTKITINKTGVNVKNGNLDISLPVSANDFTHENNAPKIESHNRCKYICRGFATSGSYDLIGGLCFVVVCTKEDVTSIPHDRLWGILRNMDSYYTTDSCGNRIKVLTDVSTLIMSSTIQCELYNDYVLKYGTSAGIIKYYWDKFISENIKHMIKVFANDNNAGYIVEYISNKLSSFRDELTQDVVVTDDISWRDMLSDICQSERDDELSSIAYNIQIEEGLSYRPKVPKMADLSFLKKHGVFFDNQDTLKHFVKLDLMEDKLKKERCK